ncbi:MAG: metal ABC transporter permease [Chlamydiia bacterium]
MNPYIGSSFFEFLGRFIWRIPEIVRSLLGGSGVLATDEVQLLVLVCVALSCGWVGSLLVLRRMTMLANSLSHTILLGIAAAFLLSRIGLGPESMVEGAIPLVPMFIAAILTGILTTFLTQSLVRWFRLHEDASTGLVFTTLFALGIVIVTLFTRNAHIGLEIVMGNADGLGLEDLKLAVSVLLVNLVACGVLLRPYQTTTFDPGFGACVGYSANRYGYILMTQVALTAVAGFRAVGVLMVLALLVGPVLAARRWSRSLTQLILWSGLVGALCAVAGVATARAVLSAFQVPLSTGACVVTWVSVVALVCIFLPDMGWIASRWQRGARPSAEGS